MLKKINQLRAGVMLSYLNLAVGNLIPILYTPIMLRLLGQEEYGVYGIANSLVGYLSLLNFGLGSSIVRYIAKYRAEGDKKNEERTVGLFFLLYTIIGALIIVVGCILGNQVGLFYGETLSGEEIKTLKILVIMLSISMGILMPLNVFASLIMAHERYVFSGVIRIISSVLSPVFNLTALYLGFASFGLVISTSALSIGVNLVYVIYGIRTLKIRPRFSHYPKGLMKEILYYSSFHFLASIVDMLYWNTDKILLGKYMGAAAVAVYNVGAMFHTYTQNIAVSISGVLMPKVTKMYVDQVNTDEYTELFIRVGRLQFLIISFIVSAFCVFGRQFIFLWAGEEYELAFWVAVLILVPSVIPWIENLGLQILTAQNKHRFRSVVYLIIAVLNVILTLWWVQLYGILGAALASAIAFIVGQGFIMNWYYWKKIGIDIPKFWNIILKMSFYPFILMLGGVVITYYVEIRSFISFFSGAFIYTLVFFVIAYRFMMNDYEKSIIAPLLKILKRAR